MKKDSIKKIQNDMQFIIGWLARPEMRKMRIGMIGGKVYKPKYVKLKNRGYLVNKSLIVECPDILPRLKTWGSSQT